jgi:hypothetical protein
MTKADFDRELQKWLLCGQKLDGKVLWTPFWSGSLMENPNDEKNPKLQSGHPLDAKLVVVGYNPSSGVDESWTEFWDPKTGFDLKKFQICRTAKCKRDGKKRDVSRTRRKIYELTIKTVGWNVVIVNTNIYWAVSSIAKKLEGRHKHVAPIEWLLEKIPNAVVVTHGKPAREKYKDLQSHRHNLPDATFAPHLSRISAECFEKLISDVCVAVSK